MCVCVCVCVCVHAWVCDVMMCGERWEVKEVE